MKSKFSTSWKASKQPRKQRKYIHNAPMHIKRKFLSATLEKELRKKYSRRSIELRKGDEVKIMSGSFKKKQGKIEIVDTKKSRVSIEGIQRTKKDGTKIPVFFHASKLKIITLNIDDKKRLKLKSEKIKKEKEIQENKQNKTKK